MPMNENSTPNQKPVKKVKKFYAQPSENSIAFLMNFARNYIPEKTKLLYN